MPTNERLPGVDYSPPIDPSLCTIGPRRPLVGERVNCAPSGGSEENNAHVWRLNVNMASTCNRSLMTSAPHPPASWLIIAQGEEASPTKSLIEPNSLLIFVFRFAIVQVLHCNYFEYTLCAFLCAENRCGIYSNFDTRMLGRCSYPRHCQCMLTCAKHTLGVSLC